MKRIGNIWNEICVLVPESRRKEMEDETYMFHPLQHMTTHERKERSVWFACDEDNEIMRPVAQVLSRYLIPKFSGRSYSSIKGRGLLSMVRKTKQLASLYKEGYCLVIDIKKCFENMKTGMLMNELCKYVKDVKVLRFIKRRLEDCPVQGLPIGLPFSSYLANMVLTDTDRMCERNNLDEVRFMDDIVVFCNNKEKAKDVLLLLTKNLSDKGLTIKNNVRITPVSKGIIFCGFKIWPTHVLLRKNIREAIKKRHRMLIKMNADDDTYKRLMAPYFGWMIHCNGWHLLRKTLGEKIRVFENNIMEYKKLRDKKAEQNWFSLPRESRISIRDLIGKDVVIFESKEVELYNERKCAFKFCYPDNEKEIHYTITRSEVVMDRLKKDTDAWPAVVTFVEKKGANGRAYVAYE